MRISYFLTLIPRPVQLYFMFLLVIVSDVFTVIIMMRCDCQSPHARDERGEQSVEICYVEIVFVVFYSSLIHIAPLLRTTWLKVVSHASILSLSCDFDFLQSAAHYLLV